ncbi:glycosyl hydrolase catalytic core-domain-containing protein [Mycena sanguinolenta]|nr:glycosyl hydrolase catalytic core-domain-containing protein [Mycena sanguinolenta]
MACQADKMACTAKSKPKPKQAIWRGRKPFWQAKNSDPRETHTLGDDCGSFARFQFSCQTAHYFTMSYTNPAFMLPLGKFYIHSITYKGLIAYYRQRLTARIRVTGPKANRPQRHVSDRGYGCLACVSANVVRYQGRAVTGPRQLQLPQDNGVLLGHLSKRFSAFSDMDSSPQICSINFDPAIFEPPKVSWLYNWGQKNSPRNTELPFYAPQWNTDGIASPAANAKAANTLRILGFNEPDISSQANMTPAASCSIFPRSLREASSLRCRHSPTGALRPAWRCTYDYIALDWYPGWTDDFTEFIDSAKKYNKPIYPTGPGEQVRRVPSPRSERVKRYLDREPAVVKYVKYAFFGAFTSGTGKDVIAANACATLASTGIEAHRALESEDMPSWCWVHPFSSLPGTRGSKCCSKVSRHPDDMQQFICLTLKVAEEYREVLEGVSNHHR